MADIIDFENIKDEKDDKLNINALIEMQEFEAEMFANKLKATSEMCRGITKLMEEVCGAAGVKGDMYPTDSYATFLAMPIDAALNEEENPFFERKVPIFASHETNGIRYVFTLGISEAKTENTRPAADRIMRKDIDIKVTMYRVSGWKCEYYDAENKKWAETTWQDMTGFTKEQNMDMSSDDVLAEMLEETTHIEKTVSDELWKELKKQNKTLLNFYRDPAVNRSTCLFVDRDENGKIFAILQPANPNKEGAAIRCEGRKLVLMMYGPEIMDDVCTFNTVKEAKKFIRIYFDRYDNGEPSLTLPLSKNKVIEIDDIEDYGAINIDRYVKNVFKNSPLTEDEKGLADMAKEIVEIYTDIERS